MYKKLFALICALLMFSAFALAEDILIYEANFTKDDDPSKVNWVSYDGDWSIESGLMVNYDTSSQNTAITQELDQSKEGIYIYEYKMSYFETSVTWGPMSGLHFMASQPDGATRGESYLMWHDRENIQFYKCTNNRLNYLQQVAGYLVGIYDERLVRIELNTKTGEIKGYIDGELVIDVVDTSPHKSGKYISLRTSSTATEFDYVRVWFRPIED